jgi:small ligand-binding sensory domain FIST
MRWVSTLQTGRDTEEAVRAAARDLEAALDGHRADLLLAFVSDHHAGRFPAVPALLRQRFPGAAIAGCSAKGVAAVGQEVEDGPALGVLAAHLPDVEVRVVHAEPSDPPLDVDQWRALVGVEPLAQPVLIVLPEPFSVAGEVLVRTLDEAYPHSPKVGGVASGGDDPGDVALFADGFVHRRGVVAVALTGDVAMDTVVAQGARPVGPPLAVTAARGNLLATLDGQPATARLAAVFEALGPTDRALFQRQPMIGISPEGGAGVGDYLVRGVLGVHRASGTLAVGFPAEAGQEVRFHVRDAASASEELRTLLERHREGGLTEPARGAVLFSCLGRGRRFFGQPDHDVGLIEQVLGPTPLTGFFCNGEIGPVKGRTHLHGYTSALGLFRRAGWN